MQKKNVLSLGVSSTEQQKMVFLKRDILAPPNSRCCKDHLYDNHIPFEDLQEITSTQGRMVPFDADSTMELLTGFFTIMQSVKAFDFDELMPLDEGSYFNTMNPEKEMSLTRHDLYLFLIQINLTVC